MFRRHAVVEETESLLTRNLKAYSAGQVLFLSGNIFAVDYRAIFARVDRSTAMDGRDLVFAEQLLQRVGTDLERQRQLSVADEFRMVGLDRVRTEPMPFGLQRSSAAFWRELNGR